MYLDSKVEGGKVRLKNSTEAGDVLTGGLTGGELALNSADGALYYQTAGGGVGQFPSAVGFTRIVSLTQAAYDALVSATATDPTTLYIVTPD